MNQYRCETCEHRFTPDYWKDGCNRFGKTFVSDDEMRFIFTYGCASHSSYQSERDKALTCLQNLYFWVEYNDDLFEYDDGDKKVMAYQAILDAIERRIKLFELRQAGEP